MTRTGTGWDVAAALALLLAFAGVGLASAGGTNRRSIVAAGRYGALAGVAIWVALLVATAAPTIGRFSPDALAMASAAGLALVAAALATGEDGPVPVSAPPVAAVLALALGAVAEPGVDGLGRGSAMALVAAAAVVVLASALRREAALALPLALFAGLRGAAELADPPAALPVVIAAVVAAAALATGVLQTDRTVGLQHTRAVVLGLGALAAAVAPVPEVRQAAGLLAAAAVLAAVEPDRPWPMLAALPGAALATAGLADVPVPDGPNPIVHVGLAVLLATAAAALVAGARRRAARPSPVAADEVRAAVIVLVAWLALAPGSWRWTLPDDEVLAPWDRAAATAAVVGMVVAGGGSAPVLDRIRRRTRK